MIRRAVIDHIAADHIHIDIKTCNIEESQQKYRLSFNPAARFAFCLFYSFFLLLFVVVSLVNQSRTKGEGWSTTN